MTDKKQEDEEQSGHFVTQQSIPASVTLVLGDEMVIQAQGTEEESFKDVYHAVTQEARYWMKQSDMVIIQEGDEVHQHIHRNEEGV